MKIGILTFHCAVNYGAILQAYALKEVLCRMGHDVHVIDYRPHYLTTVYRPFGYRPGLKSLLKVSGWILWYFFLIGGVRKIIRNRKFKTFAACYLSLDQTPLSGVACKYDVIVCGSDQIWNPSLTGHRLDAFFFGLLPDAKNVKVISYAASVGHIGNLKGHESVFLAYLRNLSAIGVRERHLAEHISALDSNLLTTMVVDPTVLAGRGIFDAISSGKSLIEKPYLLYFSLSDNPQLRQNARAVAKERYLEFIEVTTYYERVPGQKLYRPASPAEFCSLFKHANYVVCSSFHGMAFSILFNRQFIVYAGAVQGLDRFVSLLSELGLMDRLISSDVDFAALRHSLMTAIDYSAINTKLDDLRRHSLDWLRNTLKYELPVG